MIIAYIVVVTIIITYVEPYLPYVGLAVIVIGAALLVKAYFDRRKFW